MRKIIGLLAVFVLSSFLLADVQEGVLNQPAVNRPANTLEAAQSMSDWYDCKILVGAIDTASVITIATYWGTTNTYSAKAIYNSAAAATTIRIATSNSATPAAADTLRVSLDGYGATPKLPSLAKIFKLAETDTIIVFLQVRK